MHADRVAPVLIGESAGGAGIGLVVDEVLTATRVDAAEDQAVERAAAGHDAVRGRRRQRAHQQVAQHVAGGGAVADGRRRPAIEHAAFGGRDLDGAKISGVRRQCRVGDRLDRVIDRGLRGDERHVAGAAHLRIGAGEIETHRIAADRNRDLQPGQPIADAVIVEIALVLVDAVGQLPHLGAGAGFRIVEQADDGGFHDRGAEAAEDVLNAADADRIGGDLRAQVALALARRPGI